MAWTRRGDMYLATPMTDPASKMPWRTYPGAKHKLAVAEYVGGEWRHFPIRTALDNFWGANYGFNYAQGNFMTRKYRQKGFLHSPLEKIEHKRTPAQLRRKIYEKIKPKEVVIPTVTQRRTKNLLVTNTKMPMYRPKRPNPYVKTSKSKTTSKKGATNRKNKKPTKAKPKSATKVLQKEVKALKQAVNTINSHHTYKIAATASLKSLIGRCNHGIYPGSTVSLLEAATANLRFFDPAAPATLVTANLNTGTYSRDITISNFYLKTLLRNNYQVPCRVKVYLCKTKVDQNDSVLSTYTNAIADQVINAGVDETDALIYITDIERMKELWSIDCVIDRVLEPGQEAEASHSTGKFQYDPSHVDAITDAYQKSLNSFDYLIRVEGVLGHDTAVATEQSLLLAGVDIHNTIKVNIEYNSGGADLNDIYITENRIQAFTNGGVASLKPVADNLAYSIS